MSTTKQVKDLLQEVRRQLDEESLTKVEPILRTILDAAKPRTAIEVKYQRDPGDQAEIDALRAAIRSKENHIAKLQSMLPRPKQFDHMLIDELLEETTKFAAAWIDGTLQCMCLLRRHELSQPDRKVLLEDGLRLSSELLLNYLVILEGLNRIPRKKLRSIISERIIESLKKVASDVQTTSGIKIDLSFSSEYLGAPPRNFGTNLGSKFGLSLLGDT